MPDWRLASWLMAAVAYALLSHGLMLYAADRPWAVAALLGPGLLALGGFALAGGRTVWLAGVALAGAALALVTWHGGVGDVNRLYLAQHAGIHLALAVSFAYTLRLGGVPMISAFALRVHANGLTPDMWRYTRTLTGVWAFYFAAMALASVAIFSALSWSAWSLFANLLTPLFAVALFGGEHLLRYRLHPEFERANWREALRASMATDATVVQTDSERGR